MLLIKTAVCVNFSEMFYIYRDHAWRAIFSVCMKGKNFFKKFNRMFSLHPWAKIRQLEKFIIKLALMCKTVFYPAVLSSHIPLSVPMNALYTHVSGDADIVTTRDCVRAESRRRGLTLC